MKNEELKEWLEDKIFWADSELERWIESSKDDVIPDRVSRRVIETEALCYRIVLRKVKELEAQEVQ